MSLVWRSKKWLSLAVALVAIVLSPVAALASAPYLAGNVLGQPDFLTSTAATTQSGLTFPQAVAVDNVHNRIFVADSNNRRVLVYEGTTVNGQPASYVIGQPDFTSSASAVTQNGMSNPYSVIYDPIGDRLFVRDSLNSRILVYSTATITNGMNASYVIGQANFTSSTAATTQSGLRTGRGLAYDTVNKRLYAGDTNRVMVYDVATITNGMNASYVIGQANFTANVSSRTQSTFADILSVAYDSVHQRLFTAEYSVNNRVLVFNTSTITNGMNAANVIGQPDFTSNTTATTQNGFARTSGVAYDPVGNQLFVADYVNNRAMVFNVATITNGMNASGQIGQTNFTTVSGGVAQDKLNFSNDIAYDSVNRRLLTSDVFVNRVMIFNFAKLVSTVPGGTTGAAYSVGLGTQTQGATTYSLTTGALPPGLSLNAATGQLTGTPTAAGSYSFSISVSDNNGLAGTYADTASYSLSIVQGALPGLPKTGVLPVGLAAGSLLVVLAGIMLATGGIKLIRHPGKQ